MCTYTSNTLSKNKSVLRNYGRHYKHGIGEVIKSLVHNIMLLVFKENVNKSLIVFFILLRLVCQNDKQTNKQ